MKRSSSPLFSILKPVIFFAGAIYFSVFALAGAQVVRLQSVMWHADALLPFEVFMWGFFAVMLVKYGKEALGKL